MIGIKQIHLHRRDIYTASSFMYIRLKQIQSYHINLNMLKELKRLKQKKNSFDILNKLVLLKRIKISGAYSYINI